MNTETTLSSVAAFTDDPAAGSLTGVVLDAGDLSTETMQRIASQSGCSHTAFVREIGQDEVSIRFITATGEIKNCAHATIAAHYLRAKRMGIKEDMTLKQQALSGIQDVEVRCEDGQITVSFKQDPINFHSVMHGMFGELVEALHVPNDALEQQFPLRYAPVVLASPGAKRFMVALNSVEALNALVPDFPALKAVCARFESIGCFVFAMQSPTEASARMFAPNIGVDEDVINGNSSGCLGAYLLRFEKDMTELHLKVHQGQNFDRPGTVGVSARRVGRQIETWVGGRAAYVSERVVRI